VSEKKPKQVRVYLDKWQEEVLNSLTAQIELSETQLLTVILAAGLRAVSDNGNRLVLPLKFHILTGEDPLKYRSSTLNDPTPKALRK
jgi:hypothetical protein